MFSEVTGSDGSCSGRVLAGTSAYEAASALAKSLCHARRMPLYAHLHPFALQDHVRARGFGGQRGQKKSYDDGCVFDGLGSLLAYSTWTSAQSKWHINFLELRAVSLALQHFLPFLKDQHVLIQLDNRAAVSYINHQGGIRSRRLPMLARLLFLWPPQTIQLIWSLFREAEIDLFA